MAVRTNQSKNPSFEVDLSGYQFDTTHFTATRDTTQSNVGSASAHLVYKSGTGTGQRPIAYGFPIDSSSITLPSNTPVTVSLYAKGTTVGNSFGTRLIVHLMDAAGNWQSDTTTSISVTSSWQRFSVTTATLPSGYKVGFSIDAGGGDFYVDGVLVEFGSSVGTYFDGSTTGAGFFYSWNGPANASTSSQYTGTGFNSALSGSGTLTSALSRIQKINRVKNPNFEYGSKFGWNGSINSGSSALDSTLAHSGTTSLKVTATGSGLRVRGSNGSAQLSEMFTVVPGNIHNLSAWVYTSATASVNIYAYGANSGGTPSAPYTGTTVSVTANTWTRIDTNFSVPSGSTDGYIYPNFEIASSTAGLTLNIDDVHLQTVPSNSLPTYFDGDTAAGGGYTYGWTGVAGQSNSIQMQPIAPPGNTIASPLSASATLTSSLAYTKRIASALGGSATLTSRLSNYQKISSPLSATVTLTSKLTRNIRSALSGSVTLTSVLSGWHFTSNLGGTVTLTSALHRNIASALSGSVTLTSALTGIQNIASDFSASVTLTSYLGNLPKQIASKLGGEVVLYSELEYIVQPQPLADLPLGKLARYTVNNTSVPVNPAHGSGSTPSVNATYVKGKNPEFALGENFTVDNGAVGTYTGEVVRLTLNKKSDVATISTDTALTKTNVDMHLFPFMDSDPGLWTAARAIEYWTQQAGVFYDKVEGECPVYASGYGHPNGYAERAGNSHFYDKLTAGTNSTAVVNDRSVTTFGTDATAVMAQHEAEKTRVPVTVGANRKLVFSVGMGLRGSGRVASVSYRFLDGLDQSYIVNLVATSEGAVAAQVNGIVASTINVPAGGNYRFTFSLQRMSETALVVKLTAHEDDLAGNGNLIVNGPAKAIATSIPGTLWLTSLIHTSAGGSGAEMLRWGTYLSVTKFHPLALPGVQKTLEQSKKPLGFVSGFSTNVWKSLNEFCAINRLDLSFVEDRMVVGPRMNGFNGSVKFADFELTAERREKYRQVAVVNKKSRAVRTETAVLWRADSVYQVAAREVFETTVQTEHSILSVVNPVAVTGIWPFPYREGAGQYVVTGADGYIVSPQWWYDNGGKVEASLTEKDGEIAIKITAPIIDTVRAPYRISEGAGDRPALYISGSGIVNTPEELHINTGAKNAREGFDNVFDSPFIATANNAFDTAARMAQEYSAAAADVSFGVPNDFDTPSVLGTYPSGVVFTDNSRNFKITDASQTHSETTGNAIPFTTIAAYNASFPEGATIRDEKDRHLTRTIKHAIIKPLRSNDA